jgi:hypothetical protein
VAVVTEHTIVTILQKAALLKKNGATGGGDSSAPAPGTGRLQVPAHPGPANDLPGCLPP